jgi:tetratricopeptide (TPR) repeat protein
VVKNLPDKVKFVFAQRPEDELVKGRAFKGLKNICYIPDGRLGALKESDVGELVRLRANDVGKSGNVLKKAVKRYKGHPYAIVGALDIVKKTKSVENLPQDPTPEAIAEAQWERICDTGDQGIKLFESYAILEVGVPDDVVQKVSGLSATTRKRLQNDSYLRGLLREEGAGKRIYHAILADYILGQIGETEKNQYHSRAVEVYRGKLAEARKEQIRPDALAAMRLAEHVLVAEGKEAFVRAFVNECTGPLLNLGLFDTAISLSQRALEMIAKSSKEEEAALTGNLGLIYGRRGELDKAEEMNLKSLEIEKKLGRQEGMARQLGNLGAIHLKRGELDKAEEMHRKSLDIAEKLGLQEIMASDYGNLGLIYIRRGELDKAEEMYLKSLEISEPCGMMELTANQHGNLGLVYMYKGELDKAEQMFMKILKIHKDLGHKEGMANDYINLGSVYRQKGDIGKAREYGEKALGLYEKIGMPHMVEKWQGWLDGIGTE